MRERIAEWYARSQGLKFTKFRTMTALSKGETPGPENSIHKLVNASKLQDIASYGMDLMGEAGMVIDDDLVEAWGMFQSALLSSPSARIAGGSDEILKNIIAERVLGLPAGYKGGQEPAVQLGADREPLTRPIPGCPARGIVAGCCKSFATKGRRMRILQPLRGRSMALLWGGLSLSAIGRPALCGRADLDCGWRLGSNAGYFSALQALIALLAVLSVGAWADRWEQSRGMIAADLASAACFWGWSRRLWRRAGRGRRR